MITAEAIKPMGLAIKDFYAGDLNAEVQVHRDDGFVSCSAVSALFRGPVDFQVDKVLIDLCSGKILDAGAGAGIHSLYLQNLGYMVYAVDISSDACKVMQRRGIKNVICGNLTDLSIEPCKTLLILGRSIGMVETLAGLEQFLADARRLVTSGGQILLNSLDVRETTDPQNLAYQERNRRAGKYIGEIRLHMEYQGISGPETGLLHVDAVTLAGYAAKTGWSCDVVLREKGGHYAASLQKID